VPPAPVIAAQELPIALRGILLRQYRTQPIEMPDFRLRQII
jgi:hypothetical protein